MTTPPDKDPLAALIDKAQVEVSRKDFRKTAPKEKSTATLPLGTAILLVCSLVSAYVAWRQLAPPSPDVIERDLAKVVEDARSTVEAAKSSSGRLPDVLPNASLSALVQYEHDANEYKLSASMLGLRVTISRDGSKSVEKE